MRLALDSSGVALGTSWLFRPLCKEKRPQTPNLFILVFPSPPTKFSLWFPPRAWPPQPADLTARNANVSRESRRISREDVGTSRSSPLASTRAAGNQRSTSQRAPAPLPAHCPSRLPQPTDLTAKSANFNRESQRISREDVGTSWSSPLASTRAAGNQRSTSQRAPAPCPPGSRNPPTSRPWMQTLAGKVAESAGRIPARAGPRRSHASAQWHGSFHLHVLRPPVAR